MPVGALQLDLAFQVDQLSAVMLLVVTGVGSLIHLFSVGYMKEDPGFFGRCAAVELARELYERRNGLGVELVGFIDADACYALGEKLAKSGYGTYLLGLLDHR